ncbi:helix-turn-helix domain-containing protein [Roseomonas sp. JC162]|uniref:Helix-turn-helix domain-containing protein n=1 Tax=Neoroseomonas marina TaxID=1232220 RepID=A0A848E928_9PROT|nr:helix-turn-helix domain-containing protein [Neoroseomonas marina]NMJ40586.1 helix-turn-helix domain-containing protein [Neoroseomonas marina]
MDQFAAMPLVMQFDDPAVVASALRDAAVEYLSFAPGQFSAKLTSVAFSGVRLQIMSDGPHLSRGTVASGNAAMLFALGRPQTSPMVNSHAMSGADLMLLGPGGAVESRVTAPIEWAAVSFDADAFARTIGEGDAPGLGEFAPRRLSASLRAGTEARVREIGAIAAADPQRLLATSVQSAIADEFQHFARQVTQSDLAGGVSLRALRRRVQLVRLADEYMASRIDQSLYSEEVRAALGVPMRTLHDAFIAVHGMSMHRYLRIRRLNLARRSLRADAGAGQTQVKAAALRYGFWHFGRFAQEYRALFGELPSETARMDSGT